MSQQNKVALLVCGGIGRIVSTVVRRAAYMVVRERPDEVVLISSGSLTGNVSHELNRARELPLIAVDACGPRCATALVEAKDLDPERTIWLPDVATEHRLSIRGEDRKSLGQRGMKLARALADEIIHRVDTRTGKVSTDAG